MYKAILAALLITFSSHAEEATLPLQKYATSTIDTLIERGVTNVGDLSLNELREKIQDIDYNLLEGSTDMVARERNSAYYRYNQVYSRDDYSNSSNQDYNIIKLLATHEALGALGYHDENYEKTVILESLTQIRPMELNQYIDSIATADEFNSESLYHPHLLLAREAPAGGATGIGGGGDIGAIYFKYLTMKEVTKYYDWNHIHFTYFNSIQFESSTSGEKEIRITPIRYYCSEGQITHFIKQEGDIQIQTIVPRIVIPQDFHHMDSEKQRKYIVNVASLLISLVNPTPKKVNGSDNEADNDATCGNRILRIHQSTKDHPIFKRSNALDEFVGAFKFDCMSDLGLEQGLLHEIKSYLPFTN